MAEADSDLYPKIGNEDAEANEPAPDAESTQEDSTDNGGDTALVPKSVLAGMDLKPGQEVSFKVAHVYDDEVALSLVKAPETEEEPARPSANEEIDGMAGMMKGMM